MRAITNCPAKSSGNCSDPWQEAIAKFVAGRTLITTDEVLRDCIHLDLERQDRNHEMRVGSILKQLGWIQERKRINGKQKRVWLLQTENNF